MMTWCFSFILYMCTDVMGCQTPSLPTVGPGGCLVLSVYELWAELTERANVVAGST